jgi:hypothetical protein
MILEDLYHSIETGTGVDKTLRDFFAIHEHFSVDQIVGYEKNVNMYLTCAAYFAYDRMPSLLAEDSTFLMTLRAIVAHPMGNFIVEATTLLAKAAKTSVRNVENYFTLDSIIGFMRSNDPIVVSNTVTIIAALVNGWGAHVRYTKIVNKMLRDLDILSRKDTELNMAILSCIKEIVRGIPRNACVKDKLVNVVIESMAKYRTVPRINGELVEIFSILLESHFDVVYRKLAMDFVASLARDPITAGFNYEAMTTCVCVLENIQRIIAEQPDRHKWTFYEANAFLGLTVSLITEHSIHTGRLLSLYVALLYNTGIQVYNTEEFALSLVGCATDECVREKMVVLLDVYYHARPFHDEILRGMCMCGVLSALKELVSYHYRRDLENIIDYAMALPALTYSSERYVLCMVEETRFHEIAAEYHEQGRKYVLRNCVRMMTRIFRFTCPRTKLTIYQFLERINDAITTRILTRDENIGIFPALSRYSRVGDIGIALQMLKSAREEKTSCVKGDFIGRFFDGRLPCEEIYSIFPHCMKHPINVIYSCEGVSLLPDSSLLDLPWIANAHSIEFKITHMLTCAPDYGVTVSGRYYYDDDISNYRGSPVSVEEALVPFSRKYLQAFAELERAFSVFNKEELSREMFHVLSNARQSVYGSPHIEFVHRYHYFFNFSLRLYAYKMKYLPAYNRVLVYMREHGDLEVPPFFRPVKLSVSARNVLAEGRVLLYTMCANSRYVEVSLKHTEPHGFYNTFSCEFIRDISSDYIDEGYFPHAATPKRDIVILGILLARVLYFGITVGVRLNPMFFASLRCHDALPWEDIDERLQRVDPALYNRLKSSNSLVGTLFIYRGRRALPLEHGCALRSVTDSDSREKYCRLMTSFTCGQDYADNMFGALREGFDSVLSRTHESAHGLEDLLSMFTDDECATIFSGEVSVFSDDDMEHIMTAGGYTESSLVMLKNILERWDTNMKKRLLCFVTAMSSLPYGGLAKLRPRFTVAPLVRGRYPESRVSSHTLYMPVYPSEISMERGLRKALRVF